MVRYYVESLSFLSGKLKARGWLFHQTKCLSSLTLQVVSPSGGSTAMAKVRQERRDVAGDHDSPQALESGFEIVSAGYTVPCRLSLLARFEDGEDAVIPLGEVLSSADGPEFQPAAGAPILSVQFRTEPRFFQEFKHLPYVASSSLGASMQFLRPQPIRFPPIKERIDLLIAIYNAERFFDSFFGSLLRNTTSPYRLIMVDDGNPNDVHYNKLCEVAAQVPDSIVMRNDKNMGFIYSICRAFEKSSGHFAMINSDTELPPGWLERLMAPILERPEEVASTTPFTNAGEVVSFPDLGVDNRMFMGLENEQLDHYFACVDPMDSEIEVISGVGFCMGFNRRVVDHIGYFDAPTFGRGYSEENDWSLRARKAGYRNVVVPNLFVRHEHGASYLPAEKRTLLARNLAIVEQRYPGYHQDVQDYYDLDPMLRLRQAIALFAACGEAKESGTVLVIDHCLGGGANYYRQSRVAEWVADGRPVISALIERGSDLLDVVATGGGRMTEFSGSHMDDLVASAPLLNIREILLNTIVASAQPLALLAAIAEIKRLTGAKLTFAGHDFYPICPSYTLLDETGRHCGLDDLGRCGTCLPANRGEFLSYTAVPGDIADWRQAWGRFFAESCDLLECYSQSSIDLFCRAYPQLADKAVLRPHKVAHITRKATLPTGESLHVGILGGINYAKGSDVVRGLAEAMAQAGDGSRLTVIGSVNADLDPSVATVTGNYDRERLAEIVEQSGVSVFLVPSIWPETFSYVTEELIQLGVPVAVFDLGAPAERVRHYSRGRVLTLSEPKALLAELWELHRIAS